MAFFEQQQQKFEPKQAVQVEAALGFIESQIFISIYTWFGCHYRRHYGTMVSDRLSFKQYIPGKAHKYGVKIYKLAATNGYTWNYIIYTGQQHSMADLGHAQTVVMHLLDDLEECYRTAVADNFFTSIPLAKRLLEHDTYLIGTLRSNRAGLGSEVAQKHLRRGEVYGRQNKEGVKSIMWKDKKNVLTISTRPSDSATVVDTGNINSKNERIMKSEAIQAYNEGRIGIGLSD